MKYKHTAFFISLLVFTALITLPLTGFAKEKERHDNKDRGDRKVQIAKSDKMDHRDDNDNDGDDNDKSSRNSISEDSRKCLQAWGHLIARGWLSKNTSIDIEAECHVPFGIDKKFRGHNATTTPDVTAPVISSITFNPAKTQAEVRWTTNERSNSTVFWSTTSSVDTSTSTINSITKNSLKKDHRVVIKNLMASTTYYVVVRSRDRSGNVTTSEVKSFMTKAPSPDNTLPVVSNIVTLVGTSTIKVGWMTNELTTGRVYYSPTLPVIMSATSSIANSATTTKNQIVDITGLNPDTIYYLVVEATDLSGNVTTSATFSAHTTAYATTTPPATTTDATAPVITASNINVSPLSAVVNWVTNEAASSKVFYGTTSPLDLSTTTTMSVMDANLINNHSVFIGGLTPSTQYYVIIRSTDAVGNTSTSSQMSFITPSGL